MEGRPSLIAILYFAIDHRDGTLGAMRPFAKIATYGAAIVCSAVLAVLLLLAFAVPERTAAALLSLEVGPCDHELKSCLKKWLARAFPDASPELAGAVTLSVTPSMRPFGITATLSVDDVELHDGRGTDKILHVTSVLLRATPFDFRASSKLDISFSAADATASFQGTVASPFKNIQVDGELVIGAKTLATTLAALSVPPPPWLDSRHQEFDFHAHLSAQYRNGHIEQSRLAVTNAALGLGPDRATGTLVIDKHSATAGLNIESLDLDAPSNRATPLSLDVLVNAVTAGLKSLPGGYEASATLQIERIQHRGKIARIPELIGRLDGHGVISLPSLALELPGGTTAKLVVDRLNDEAKFRPNGSLSIVSHDLSTTLNWLGITDENLPEKRLQTFDLQGQVRSNGDRIELSDLHVDVGGSRGRGDAILLAVPASSTAGEFVEVEAHLTFDKIDLVDYVPRGERKRDITQPDEAIATEAALSVNFNVASKASKPFVELTKVAIKADEFSLRFPALGPKHLKDLPPDHRFLPQELAAEIANLAANLQSYQTPPVLEHLIGAAEAGERFLSVLSWRQFVIKTPMEANFRFGRLAVRGNSSEGRDDDRPLAALSDAAFHADLTAPVGQPDGAGLQTVRLDFKSAHAYLFDWDFSQIELQPDLAFRLTNGSAKFAGAMLKHTVIRGSTVDMLHAPRRMNFGLDASLQAFPDHLALNIESLSIGDILSEKHVAVSVDWDKSSPRKYALRARNEGAPSPQGARKPATDTGSAEPTADRCRIAQPDLRGDATFKFDIDVNAAQGVQPTPLVRGLTVKGSAGPGGARIEQLAIDLGERSTVRARLAAKANHEASSIGGCLFVGLATKADFDAFEAFAARTNDKNVVALAHVYDGDMSTTLVGQIQRNQNELVGLGTVDVTLGEVSSANRQKAAVARGKVTLSGGLVMNQAGQLELLNPSATRTNRFGADLTRAVNDRPNGLEVVFPQCLKGGCRPLSVTLIKASSTFPGRNLANRPFEARLYEMRIGVGDTFTHVRSPSDVPLVSFNVTTSPVPTIQATLTLETLSETDVAALRKVNEALPAHGHFDFDTDVNIGGIDSGTLLRLLGIGQGHGQPSGHLGDIRIRVHGKQKRDAPGQAKAAAPSLGQQSVEFNASAVIDTAGSMVAFPRCSPERFIAWSDDEREFAGRSKDGAFKLFGKLTRSSSGWSGDVSGNGACINVGALFNLLNQAGLANTKLLQEIDQARLDALSFRAAVPELGARPLLENLADFSGKVRWSGRFSLKREHKLWYVTGASGIDLWNQAGIPVSGSLDLSKGALSGFIQSIDPVVLDEARPAIERQLPGLHPEIVRMVTRENLPGPKVRFEGRVRSPRWRSPNGTCGFREIPSYIQDFGFTLDMRSLKAEHKISPALEEESLFCDAMRQGEWLPATPH